MHEVTETATAGATEATLIVALSLAIGDVGLTFLGTAVALGPGVFAEIGPAVSLVAYSLLRLVRDALNKLQPGNSQS